MFAPELIKIIRFYPNDEAMKRITDLTRHGVVVDKTDRNGRTALMWAVIKANVPMVKRLLRMGANPAHEDCKGRSVSWYVREKAPDEVREELTPLLNLDRPPDKCGNSDEGEEDALPSTRTPKWSPLLRKAPYDHHIDIPKKPKLIYSDSPPYWEVD